MLRILSVRHTKVAKHFPPPLNFNRLALHLLLFNPYDFFFLNTSVHLSLPWQQRFDQLPLVSYELVLGEGGAAVGGDVQRELVLENGKK